MTHAMPVPKVNAEDCPRCGCWVASRFECGCGEVHADVCANCGRYTAPTLARHQYAEPDIHGRCAQGAVLHKHEHDYDALIDAEIRRGAHRA